jgi:hypothetical protein
MNRTTKHRPSLATVIAVLALFLALGSTSHATGLLTGKQIKNESVTGKDVRNLTGQDVRDASLTGADLDVQSLDQVPRAVDAVNAQDAMHALEADKVGGYNALQLLHTSGCQSGKVLGFVRVKANAGTIPDDYTSNTQYVDSHHNCSSSLVVARRSAVGRYFVKFPGNPAYLAFAQVRFEAEEADADVCAAIRKIAVAGTDNNSFEIRLRQCGTPIYRDADFTLLLP